MPPTNRGRVACCVRLGTKAAACVCLVVTLVTMLRNGNRGAPRSVFCLRRERAGRIALCCELDLAQCSARSAAGDFRAGFGRRPDRPHPLHQEMARQDPVRYVDAYNRPAAVASAPTSRNGPAAGRRHNYSVGFTTRCTRRGQAERSAGAAAEADGEGASPQQPASTSAVAMGRRQSDGAPVVLVVELVMPQPAPSFGRLRPA